ncbi:MAG TPA: sulfotransferase [Steroidobacteraceae bacterium]
MSSKLQTHEHFVKLVETLERSVSINPALLDSWIELERLYRAMGDATRAQIAVRHRETLERLPAAVVEAGSLFSTGELAAAQRVLQEFLREHARHPEALRLLGRIAHQCQQLDDASRLFEEVLSLAPDYRAARADYVRTLIEQRAYPQAQQQLGELLEREPDNWDYLVLCATIQAGLGQHERAITTYRRVLAVAPSWVHLYLLLGNSLKAVGRQQEAIDAYHAAATHRPGLGDAYWSLANLKTYRFSDEEIERMRALSAAATTSVVDRYHVCFALGKALEDRAQYADSWRCYELGNRLKSMQTPHDPRAIERQVDHLIETFGTDRFASQAGVSHPRRTPIFIVGLPRSGSTLVEQILASHSCVEGTQELPILSRVLCEDYRVSGERYLAQAQAYTASERPLFIDKMPNNFWHIGRIHLMLPTAKIIDVRREPLACCLSNFKQLYAAGQGFTYSLHALARYYKSYVRLMNHWDEVLPNRVLHVRYEDLIEDLENQVQRLLAHCGLDPEPGCLQFHRTARAIGTASSEQVRQPINRRGLTDWRHFEPWLAPLQEALA